MEYIAGPPTVTDLDAEPLVVLAVRHGYEQPIVGSQPQEANVEAVA
ncbi:MAG: hypothetical protein ACXVUL_00080 [Solirubrobacteraceae bacterium]